MLGCYARTYACNRSARGSSSAVRMGAPTKELAIGEPLPGLGGIFSGRSRVQDQKATMSVLRARASPMPSARTARDCEARPRACVSIDCIACIEMASRNEATDGAQEGRVHRGRGRGGGKGSVAVGSQARQGKAERGGPGTVSESGAEDGRRMFGGGVLGRASVRASERFPVPKRSGA